MQAAGAHDDFAQNIVLLRHRHDAGGLAEDVLHHLGAGLNPLAILNHQQGDVLIDLVGFLGNPEQRAALAHLIAIFGTTGLFNR